MSEKVSLHSGQENSPDRTMFESSNDVGRQAVYILDPPITIPASLTMTTFAALHTKNINIPKRNCVGGAPVSIKFLKCEVCKRSYSSKSSFSNHLKRFKCLQPGNVTYPAVKDEIDNTKAPKFRTSENDALSVMCNVERLKAEEYNPILLFKPQNSKTLYGPPGLDALLNSDKSCPWHTNRNSKGNVDKAFL
ncbi:hypothetical protein CEXT_256771 [Caerostris extrusa]|uniref:C2H2-type domain-containing protein n=1 Tax=Caerostris extrusa TaxID=172846 RepID=A0AAV4MFT7_CAEEX|nr:hypothetical protein CEXT_256771 [Caerostris extrusa]